MAMAIKSIHVIVFLLFCLLPAVHSSIHDERYSTEKTTYPMINGKHELVIETLLICDLECFSVFENNSNAMLDYCRGLFWDTHLRYKQFPNASFSFRVNVMRLETKDEQNFLEKFRLPYFHGILPSLQTLQSFQAWLFEQSFRHFSKYDVAILLTGSDLNSPRGGTSLVNSMCVVDTVKETVDSSMIITLKNRDVASTLMNELGHLLGAHHKSQDSLLTQYLNALGSTKHRILESLEGKQSDCLRESIMGSDEADIDTSSFCSNAEFTGGVSPRDQCRVAMRNSSTIAIHEDTSCLSIKCYRKLGYGIFNKTTQIGIFEGTECTVGNTKGRCILGSCIPTGSHLIHVSTEQCIGNESPSKINDNAVLYKCIGTNTSTPLELLRINPLVSGGVQITMLFTDYIEKKVDSKCLSLGEAENQLWFETCNTNSSKQAWELLSQGDGSIIKMELGTQFLLVHSVTKQCVTVTAERRFQLKENCLVENTENLWKLSQEIVNTNKCKHS